LTKWRAFAPSCYFAVRDRSQGLPVLGQQPVLDEQQDRYACKGSQEEGEQLSIQHHHGGADTGGVATASRLARLVLVTTSSMIAAPPEKRNGPTYSLLQAPHIVMEGGRQRPSRSVSGSGKGGKERGMEGRGEEEEGWGDREVEGRYVYVCVRYSGAADEVPGC